MGDDATREITYWKKGPLVRVYVINRWLESERERGFALYFVPDCDAEHIQFKVQSTLFLIYRLNRVLFL